MLSEETKRWFQEKVAQNPEYLGRVFLPMLERELNNSDAALRQANRASDLSGIKYRQGYSDGVQRCCAILDGLRLSENREPAGPGLMDRISERLRNPFNTPANLG